MSSVEDGLLLSSEDQIGKIMTDVNACFGLLYEERKKTGQFCVEEADEVKKIKTTKESNCRAPYESDSDPADYIKAVKEQQQADDEKVKLQLQNFVQVLLTMGRRITGDEKHVLRHAEANVEAIMKTLMNQKTAMSLDEIAEILKSLSKLMETEDAHQKKKRDESLDIIRCNLEEALETTEHSTKYGRNATYETMKNVLDLLLEAQQMRVKYLQDGKAGKDAIERIHKCFDVETVQIETKIEEILEKAAEQHASINESETRKANMAFLKEKAEKEKERALIEAKEKQQRIAREVKETQEKIQKELSKLRCLSDQLVQCDNEVSIAEKASEYANEASAVVDQMQGKFISKSAEARKIAEETRENVNNVKTLFCESKEVCLEITEQRALCDKEYMTKHHQPTLGMFRRCKQEITGYRSDLEQDAESLKKRITDKRREGNKKFIKQRHLDAINADIKDLEDELDELNESLREVDQTYLELDKTEEDYKVVWLVKVGDEKPYDETLDEEVLEEVDKYLQVFKEIVPLEQLTDMTVLPELPAIRDGVAVGGA